MCGLKSFFKKVGNGFKKAGRWVRDKALPAVGRIVKPALNVISMLPGKIGMIGKLGSAITGVLHGATSTIPNKDVRDKLDNIIDRGNNGFQGVVDRGRNAADRVNHGIGQTRETYDRLRNDYESKIRPIVDELRSRRSVDPGFYAKH